MLPENETPELSEELKEEAKLKEKQAEGSTNSNDADSFEKNASESDIQPSDNPSHLISAEEVDRIPEKKEEVSEISESPVDSDDIGEDGKDVAIKEVSEEIPAVSDETANDGRNVENKEVLEKESSPTSDETSDKDDDAENKDSQEEETLVVLGEVADDGKDVENEGILEKEISATSDEAAGDGENEEEKEVLGEEETSATSEAVSDSSPEESEGSEEVDEEGVSYEEPEKPVERAKAPKSQLPPLNQALLPKIDILVTDKEKRHQLLTEATATDLIQLLESYIESGAVAPNIQRVGLVKRTYDALKYREDIPGDLDDRFHDALADFNKMRSAFQAKAEEIKAVNSQRKKELLEKLKDVVDAEDAMRIGEVRDIQEEWKQIGHVLREDIEPLYREYRFLLDKFYQLREMHFELLDYDRRINLQEKERLIKEAETLIPDEEDREEIDVWREKMDQLTELQQQWKAIGHVPREDLERINHEYRSVIDRFFEVRQGFMEIQDQLREENGERKKEILEKMTQFSTFSAEKPRAWNDATRQLRTLQEEWKEVGQAPQAINSELWSKYRELCNTFFNNKSDFFKRFDDFRAENLVKKRELVERVEQLKDNPDLEQTAKDLKQLQREWKMIGPVPERHSNKLWSRFRAACDAFFERRRSHYSSMHEDENENLNAKKALIEEVKKLETDSDADNEELINKVSELRARWKSIGKVPYKEKDKIWNEFRGAIDTLYESLSLKKGELRELKLKASIESIPSSSKRSGTIKSKISKIRRRISQSQEKIDQYSTNIQFIAKGKSGDKLRTQIQGEIDKEIALVSDWKKQIKQLNEMLKNPPKVKAEVENSPQSDTQENGDESSDQGEKILEHKIESEATADQPNEEAEPVEETKED